MVIRSYFSGLQVSSNKVSRAENASLRSELGGLRSQLSEASKQLEAERKSSASLHLRSFTCAAISIAPSWSNFCGK